MAMEFGTVLVLVVIAVLPIAAMLFAGGFGLLDQLGKGGLSTLDRAPVPPVPPPPTPATRMERETEIRQFVQARHDRQQARGEEPVDVESEVSRLVELGNEPAPEAERHDAALREEVRQLVIARNERRIARGEPALDVEAEIERQLADFDWPDRPDA
jgi:hypothetical protein